VEVVVDRAKETRQQPIIGHGVHHAGQREHRTCITRARDTWGQCCGSGSDAFYPIDVGSVADPRWIFSGSRIFLTKNKTLLLKAFAFHFSCRIRDEKNVWIRNRDEQMVESGSWIKHPGSATLDVGNQGC
jgi:hypothetical protein